ncbi:MFS transporter [Novosphingobium sp. ZN18A2]|uniref:MFS transporter n=2 Tax=Novosphingobium sp. ZN18A2 TaxID=3079861 RepID=UPI0030CA76C4
MTASSTDASRLPRDRLALLFTVMLTTAAGNTAMQSVMPSIGTHLGVADVWVSLAYSWSALLWMLLAPFWARRSDRRGRKAMMALGLSGFALSFALCGAVLYGGLNGWLTAGMTMALFALFRSLYGGFGSAAPPAVQAYVASRTDRATRTRTLAMIVSSFGLGTVIGPALAPLLVFPGLGLVGPFVAFTVFAVVVLVLLRLRLPNDDPRYAARGEIVGDPYSAASGARSLARRHSGEDIAEDENLDELRQDESRPHGKLHWTDARLRPWLLAGVLGGQVQSMMLGIIGFLILDRLGLRSTPDLGAGPTGLVLMSGALATLLAQWGLIPGLSLGPRTAALWGIGLSGIGVLGVALGPNLHSLAAAFAICSLGFGLFRPGFTSGMSLAVAPSEQGQVAGIVAAVNGSAYIVSPAIGVFLYDHVEGVAWIIIEAFCIAVLAVGMKGLPRDEVE